MKALVAMSALPLLMAFKAPQTATDSSAAKSLAFVEPCTIENNAFQGGEEITYKLYYNWNFVWLSAGEVTFRVHDLGNQYHLSAHGRTYKSYEWFYKVRDYYDTYVDKKTLLPTVSIRDIHEGNYRLYDKVAFDRNRGVATAQRGKTKEEATPKEYSVESCVHDVISIIYYTRNIDFNHMKKGDQFPVKIHLDNETYPLKVKYLGLEEKKRVKGQGKFTTHVFSPQVIAGNVFKEDSQMKVWVTNDENKVPLMIESPVSVGSVKAVLKRYKGLKYPFNGEVHE